MSKLICLFFLLILGYSSAAAEIVNYPLSENTIYTIYTHDQSGITTLLFPSAPERLLGANLCPEGKANDSVADFIVSFSPGNHYVSIRCRTANAIGTLTVIYHRKPYVFRLVQNSDKAMSAVTFTPKRARLNNSGNMTTPAVLKSFIDQAKNFDALVESHQGLAGKIEFSARQRVSQYPDYDVTVVRSWRWKDPDTLVFCLALKNKTEKALFFEPRKIAFATGDHTLYASMVDAADVMPPKSITWAWITITGSPDGWRNNLKADNDWRVLLSARPAVEVTPELENIDVKLLSPEQLTEVSSNE